MARVTRRTALKAIGAGVGVPSLGAPVSAREHVATVVDIPGPKVPENLAVDACGALYFGITAGEVRKLTADQTQETGLRLEDAELVGTPPGRVIGVEVVPDGTLYVASQAEVETGVWTVPQDGGDPELYAAISGFPNDVLYDGSRERLLVSESFGGAVYEVLLDADDPANAASVWIEDARLDTETFGANGLAFGPEGALFVAVTRATNDAGADVGRLVRVPVERDGSAGEAETYLESEAIFGADGVTACGPSLYVAANSRNEIVRVSPSKRTSVVASGDDGLVFPSDVLFGTVPRQRGDLFVSNFANETPQEAAVLRVRP